MQWSRIVSLVVNRSAVPEVAARPVATFGYCDSTTPARVARGLTLVLLLGCTPSLEDTSQIAYGESIDVATRAVVFDVAEAVSTRIGDQRAPVRFVVFGDYTCGFCREQAHAFDSLHRAFPDLVQIVFVPAVLGSADRRLALHAAAECAGRLGIFRQYHLALFGDGTAADPSLEWENTLGRDARGVKRCVSIGQADSVLAMSNRSLESAGVSATPVTFIDGRRLRGAHPYAVLREIVVAKLRR